MTPYAKAVLIATLFVLLLLMLGLCANRPAAAHAWPDEQHTHACPTAGGGWHPATTHTHDVDYIQGRSHIPGTTGIAYNDDHLDHRCGDGAPPPTATPAPVNPENTNVPPNGIITPPPEPTATPTPPPERPSPPASSTPVMGSRSGAAPSERASDRAPLGRAVPTPTARQTCSLYPHVYIRDVAGPTYWVIRRDGCSYRQWVHPDSPLVYAIPWKTVIALHTVPVASILSIPLDRVQPWHLDNPTSHMLVRRFYGSDDRIYVRLGEIWEHVPDLVTFVARGYRWQDVCAADEDFWEEVIG